MLDNHLGTFPSEEELREGEHDNIKVNHNPTPEVREFVKKLKESKDQTLEEMRKIDPDDPRIKTVILDEDDEGNLIINELDNNSD